MNSLVYLPIFGLAYAAALVLYRLFLHPLAKFPGPKIAAATKWYEFYHDCVKGGGGLFSYEIDRMHDRYAFGTVDHYIHRQRRAAVKTFVSKKTVQTFQSSICSTVELLCREFNHFAATGETFECGTYFLSWATDSVAKYLENSTYGLLDDARRRQDWQETIAQVVELTPLVKQFPFFMPFVLKVPGWLMQILSPKMNRVLLMHKRMRSTARQYLSLHTSAAKQATGAEKSNHASNSKIDAYRAILSSTLPEIDKQPDRVAQEVLTLLVGGSATTMRVMLRIVYHVNSTPGVLSRLSKTLDAVMTTPTTNPELEVLEKQEYLATHISVNLSRGILQLMGSWECLKQVAVVKESLRIATALTARLPLVSPSKTLLYAQDDGTEWVIPAGVSVPHLGQDATS
ncbi:MAG: hypothetical protein Q9172_004674 [Xanthocarpia lactea]